MAEAERLKSKLDMAGRLLTALAEERSRGKTFVLPVILRSEALEAVPNRKIAIDLASVGVETAAVFLAE